MIPERLSRLYRLFVTLVFAAVVVIAVSTVVGSIYYALQLDMKHAAEFPANRDRFVVQWADDTGFEHLKHSCTQYDIHSSHCTLVGQIGVKKYVIPLQCNVVAKGCSLEPGTIQITQGE